MNIFKDVFAELFKMFLGDVGLTAAIVAVVLIAAGLVKGSGLAPLVGGAFLLVGCIAVLFYSVHREAARRK